MTVGDIGAQQDQGAGGDVITAELVIDRGTSRGERGGRVPTQHLLDHAPRVAETREVVGARGAAAEHVAAFLLDPPCTSGCSDSAH
jgi:hypothetical protein